MLAWNLVRLSLLFLPLAAFASAPEHVHAKQAKRRPFSEKKTFQLQISDSAFFSARWACGTCTESPRIKTELNNDSLVKRMARYDSIFESVIDSATKHEGYRLRFKLYF
jgi:hypothetical protein